MTVRREKGGEVLAAVRVPRIAAQAGTVDEDRVKREAFKFWEAPHLHRRDGSFTNW